MKWLIHALIERVFRLFSISMLYSNRVGIKYMNQLMQSIHYNAIAIKDFDYKELFLGFDGLRDEYTLLDVEITKSPHFELMKAIDNGTRIEDTDYYYRAQKGILDSRECLRMSNDYIAMMEKKFKERVEEIKTGSYEPIQVYCVNNRYYIADGKHRAALCAYIGKTVRCRVISDDFLKDSYRMWMYSKMKKKKDFEKHLVLYSYLDLEG